jgi:valyl-tRNA synthetase
MEKNLIDLENKLAQMEKKMENSEYKTKVPIQVQAQDAEKVESLKSEMNESRKAIEGIKLLKD